MTTKTIPAYLEDERRKDCDAQLQMEAEAARIKPLNHGHHRTDVYKRQAYSFVGSCERA